MASAGRPRKSGTTANPSRGPTPLPRYQPPSNPLSADAQRALHELPRTHRLDGLKKHLSQATSLLTDVAGDVNDRYQKKLEAQQKRNARKQGNGEAAAGEDRDGDSALKELQGTVDGMTGNLEASVRKMIDSKAAVEAIEAALQDLSENVASGRGAVMPTQSTLGASQFRQGRRRRGSGSESAQSDNEEQGEGSSQPQPLGALKRKMIQHHSDYDKLSMRHKYASHNDYIGFKKIVHDALNPEHDARPMPHASTWFRDSPSSSSGPAPAPDKHNPHQHPNHSQPNNHHQHHRNNDNDDDDDELEVASERISINCPITLLPMRDPVSSGKCPHSFERTAILELISASQVRVPAKGGRGPGEKAMKCPVCEVMLSPSDLHTDAVLIRKIARARAAALQEAADSDSDPDPDQKRGTAASQRARPLEVSSDDDDEGGGGGGGGGRSGVKRERTAVAGRGVSMVPGTQLRAEGGGGTVVVDLEDEEEEDGDEDGESEEDGGEDEDEDEDEEEDEEDEEDESE